jgi:hypothetical protein
MDRIAASKELLDRGWGKAPSVTPVDDHDPLEVDELTRETQEIVAGLT